MFILAECLNIFMNALRHSNKIRLASLIMLAFVTTFGFGGAVAFAQDGETTDGNTQSPTTTTTTHGSHETGTTPPSTSDSSKSETNDATETSKTNDAESATEDSSKDNPTHEVKKEIRREKLTAVEAKVCDKRVGIINTNMDTVRQRAQNQFDRITAIYTATQKYVGEKNLTITNGATLVQTVETTKTAAQAALAGLTTAPKVSCDSDGPLADIQDFRNARLDKVDAFGAYRNAVRAYLTAVKNTVISTSTTGAKQ